MRVQVHGDHVVYDTVTARFSSESAATEAFQRLTNPDWSEPSVFTERDKEQFDWLTQVALCL